MSRRLVPILACAFALVGCAWFTAHEPQVVHGAADIVICVLEHDSEPIAKIAEDCYGVAEADVVSILTAHKQAMAREAAVKPAACPMPSSASVSP